MSAPAAIEEQPLRRNRDFNLLWAGQAVSELGAHVSALAFPLLVLATTGSPVRAGIVAAARSGEYGLTVTADPRPADLVCYDLDGSNFATSNNHIGMFEKRTGPTEFQTIEGNVDDQCKRMSRSMSTAPRIVFVRVSK